MDVFLLSSYKFCPESFMLLGNIPTEFKKILFSIYNHSWIVDIHVVTNPQLGAEIIHSHAVELALDTLPLFFVLSSVALNCQKGISSADPSGMFMKSLLLLGEVELLSNFS
jgi:hypothetical protein